MNLMYGEVNRGVDFPSAEEIVKINKFVRIIRMLSELSHKMIRSISKGIHREARYYRKLSPSHSKKGKPEEERNHMLTFYTGGSNGGKEREIQVKFSDKKIKSFLVNDKRTVREISHEIGRKLGIKNTDEFSLQLQASLQTPSSPTSSSSLPNGNFYSPMLSPHDDESYPYDGRKSHSSPHFRFILFILLLHFILYFMLYYTSLLYLLQHFG